MRKPFIIGNWKMNMGFDEAYEFIDGLIERLSTQQLDVFVGIACQSPLLVPMIAEFYHEEIFLGAQNCNDHLSGAYTGEVSATILNEIETDFCIIGHSERRQYYNETNESVNKKAKLLLDYDIKPIICVGETLEQFENNHTKEVIEKQVKDCLKDLDIKKCVIAYEPIWAIGTGKTATTAIAQDICSLIRENLRAMYGDKADEVTIQYGGSVKANNIKELMACPDIDGALVGGASLNLDEFVAILTYE
ncbi:MAG: triose-phosphate isomerase [Bacilli bacterium]|jgi:triosephosphate isomerase|nr:triose-phosphate isomerase [Bacilli bacterium]